MRRRKVQAEHCSEWRSLADTPPLNLRYTEGRWPFNTECGRASDQVCTSNRGRVGLEFGTKSVDRTPVADHDRSVLTKRWGAKTPGGPDPGAPKIPALGGQCAKLSRLGFKGSIRMLAADIHRTIWAKPEEVVATFGKHSRDGHCPI